MNQYILAFRFISSTDSLLVLSLVTFLVVILEITFKKICAQEGFCYFRNYLGTSQKHPAWEFSELLRSICGL